MRCVALAPLARPAARGVCERAAERANAKRAFCENEFLTRSSRLKERMARNAGIAGLPNALCRAPRRRAQRATVRRHPTSPRRRDPSFWRGLARPCGPRQRRSAFARKSAGAALEKQPAQAARRPHGSYAAV
jgi:hypothetical protein